MAGFKKADKKQSRLRCSIFGPSGSGKTYTSLRIATGFIQSGIDSRIAFIDSERGSASKYADRFDFDVLELDKKTIQSYIDAIKMAADNKYKVLIIDSLSHAWQELLQEIEKLAEVKYKGNTWRAWSDGTPKQKSLVDAILNFPGHIIATIRSKTEWEMGDDKKVKRVGLSPEQGKGIEYEFDMLIELSVEHYGNIIKDRTGKYQDSIIKNIGEDFGQELIAWLNTGEIIQIPSSTPAPASKPKTYENQFMEKLDGYFAESKFKDAHIASEKLIELINVEKKNINLDICKNYVDLKLEHIKSQEKYNYTTDGKMYLYYIAKTFNLDSEDWFKNKWDADRYSRG